MTTYIKDIFEFLKDLLRCEYISDLRQDKYRNTAIEIVEELKHSSINPKQYHDICQYLRKTI